MRLNNETLTELVARYQERADDRTFARIYGSFEGLLVVLAGARDGHREDLIQEGALGLLSAVQAFDAERGVPFEAYAKQRMRWAVANYSKRKVSKHHDATVHTDPALYARHEASAYATLDARQRIEALSPVLRQVAELFAQGEEGKDIARKLGVTPGRVSQLKNQLKKELA